MYNETNWIQYTMNAQTEGAQLILTNNTRISGMEYEASSSGRAPNT